MRSLRRMLVCAAPASALASALACAIAAPLGAQGRDTILTRASSVARSAVDAWNASATMRVSGALDVSSTRTIDGNVAVLNGPITVAGRVRGSLVAINADVRFLSGARVDRDVVVVGGGIAGQDSAAIGGEIRQQAELMRYHLDGDALVIDREPVYDDSWWQRHRIRHEWRRGTAYTDFMYLASRGYNRVEGFSFVAGPRVQRPTTWGAVNFEAFAVVRTAGPVRWDNETLGHDARAEFLFGKPFGLAIGARAFDVVEPTEAWQMGDDEVGLGSALLHIDYRDYFVRHGGALYARLQAGKEADLTVAFSDENWGNRAERDPWSLTRGAEAWRPNPVMDAGQLHLVTTRLRIDTRERARSPLGGLDVVVELEQGAGRLTRFGSPIYTLADFAALTPEPVRYSRAFVDLRRYNRIAPGMSLDVRVAGGGWLSGDPLPTQRRLSLGGPGTLPGYAFRQGTLDPDFLVCTNGVVQAGTPAQCDRIALAQVQIRSGFLFGAWRDDVDDDWWRPGFNNRTAWVLFADAGRGWMVSGSGSPGAANPDLTFGKSQLPPLETFKTDIGAGIDFGEVGLYWAKAVRNSSEPVRFILRLQHRF